MAQLNAALYPKKERAIKILQFGDGELARGLVDIAIQKMNEVGVFNGGVVAVQEKENGKAALLKEQDGLYTVFCKGLFDGETVEDQMIIDIIDDTVDPYIDYKKFLKYASSIDLEFVISVTEDNSLDITDIDFTKTPKTFVGKLLAFFKARYDAFHGDITKGLHVIPCEPGNDNGDVLQKNLLALAIEKKYSQDFINWITYAITYANTSISRIVEPLETSDEVDYTDKLMLVAEPFFSWNIKGILGLDKVFPTEKAGLDVMFVDDIAPYYDRDKRIVEGTYTALAAIGKNKNINEPVELLKDETITDYIRCFIVDDVCPTIDIYSMELDFFVDNLMERFVNPFIAQPLDKKVPNIFEAFKETILPTIHKGEGKKKALFVLASVITAYGLEANNALNDIDLSDSEKEIITDMVNEIHNNGIDDAIQAL